MRTPSNHENISGRLPDRIEQCLFDRAELKAHRCMRANCTLEFGNLLSRFAQFIKFPLLFGAQLARLDHMNY